MPPIGSYDATLEEHTGDLFVYGESPVASAKMNRWAGNLEAGFRLLHQALRLLGSTGPDPVLIAAAEEEPLRVQAQSSPDLTLKVSPGIALAQENLIGLFEEATLPTMGAFTVPAANPRIDTIGIKPTGEWTIVAGTEAASPVAPDLEEGDTPLAQVYLRVGATSIENADDSTNGYLIDIRPDRLFVRAHEHVGPEIPAESPDGARTAFSTSTAFVAGSLRVYVNGLQQLPTTNYTEDSDLLGYTFVTAPPTGYTIHHELQPG